MDIADEEKRRDQLYNRNLMRTGCDQIEEISSFTVDESLFRYSSSDWEAHCLSIPHNGFFVPLCAQEACSESERTFPFCVGLVPYVNRRLPNRKVEWIPDAWFDMKKILNMKTNVTQRSVVPAQPHQYSTY
jgi:hypothetical protein